MNINKLILDKIKLNHQVTSQEITKETGFTRTYVNRFFQDLRNRGEIVLVGKANNACYVLANKKNLETIKNTATIFRKIFKNFSLSEEDVLRAVKQSSGVFSNLKDNVRNIAEYAFLEMINNAIDHSGGENIVVEVKKEKEAVIFSIKDDGVGIFEHLRKKFGLPDTLSAVQQLLKGKQTTNPENHSGQGIFFTSKMADAFTIKSSSKVILFNNLIPDLFLTDQKTSKGTTIIFAISTNSNRIAEEVFRAFTNEEYEFSKTEIKVKLYKISRNLLSRSEARRILFGLESFTEIILDFQEVETIGQSFADEVFRIWKNKNPDKKITYENANENVEFMIKRSLV